MNDIADIQAWLNLKMGTGRYSMVLVTQLVLGAIDGSIDVHAVYDQIGHLEGLDDRQMGTKSADQFKHLPLKDLWKSHYFDARFFVRNLRNDAYSPEAWTIFTEMADAINRGESPSPQIHNLIIGRYEARHREAKMTGEWIVFAKVDDVNYYLTLAVHDEGDHNIYERVKACAVDFPELDILRG